MPAGEAIAQTLTSARTVSKQLAKEVSHNGRIHDCPLGLRLFLTGHDNLIKDRMFPLSYWVDPAALARKVVCSGKY